MAEQSVGGGSDYSLTSSKKSGASEEYQNFLIAVLVLVVGRDRPAELSRHVRAHNM